MHKKDYYLILRVPDNASADEVKRAYRALAIKFHPDKNPGDTSAEEKFKEIAEAYEILQDPIKRNLFDQWKKSVQTSGYNRAGRSTQSQKPSKAKGFGARGNPDDDTFEGFIHDIFGDFFGKQRSERPSGKEKGVDLRYNLQIDLEEAAQGLEKLVRFVRKRGGREETASVIVKVPPGVESGFRFRLMGEGDSSETGTPGDLFVVVEIRKHTLFQVDGKNVSYNLPLDFSDAAFGCKIEIPTPVGFVELDVPKGTPSGRVFRLRGKGYPSKDGGPKGDVFVRAMIDAPTEMNHDHEKLFLQMKSAGLRYPQKEDFIRLIRNLRKG